MQTDDPDNFFRTESAIANEEARKAKAAKTKGLGDPIDIPAKPLALKLSGNDVWIAGSDATIRRINLQNGSVEQVLKGHSGPVTSLDLIESDGQHPLLASGSWDKTIKIWNTTSSTKFPLSSTDAHTDFVKALISVPALKLLISSGSDNVIRFWDASNLGNGKSLECIGLLSAHTRPVQCLCVDARSASNATLFSADTMGVIKVWNLERQYGDSPSCRGTQQTEYNTHRTGVNDMWYGEGQLWTGSTDETIILHNHPANATPKSRVSPITLPKPVKAILPVSLTDLSEPYLLAAYGDVMRVYDVSSLDSPEVIQDIDAHWHDVTALRLWFRKSENEKGQMTIEPFIISSSLDGTLRRWSLKDLLTPATVTKREEKIERVDANTVTTSVMTEEEEKELQELLDDD